MGDHSPQITEDTDNKKITIIRAFDSSLENVWRAWTERELLDQWWAPDPYAAKTISLNFTEGGTWLYTLQCQNVSTLYAIMQFRSIDKLKRFEAVNFICDEKGNKDPGFPTFTWRNTFISLGAQTKVVVEIYFENHKDLETIIGMGFIPGLSSALNNLEKLLFKTNTTI